MPSFFPSFIYFLNFMHRLSCFFHITYLYIQRFAPTPTTVLRTITTRLLSLDIMMLPGLNYLERVAYAEHEIYTTSVSTNFHESKQEGKKE